MDWHGIPEEFRNQIVTGDARALLIDTSEALPVVAQIRGRLDIARDTLGISQGQVEAMLAGQMIPRVFVEPGRMVEAGEREA